jgi:hypothetical protein
MLHLERISSLPEKSRGTIEVALVCDRATGINKTLTSKQEAINNCGILLQDEKVNRASKLCCHGHGQNHAAFNSISSCGPSGNIVRVLSPFSGSNFQRRTTTLAGGGPRTLIRTVCASQVSSKSWTSKGGAGSPALREQCEHPSVQKMTPLRPKNRRQPKNRQIVEWPPTGPCSAL